MHIEVVNITLNPAVRSVPGYVYIGRAQHARHLGNPFTHLPHTLAQRTVPTCAKAVQAYRDWLSGTAYPDLEPARRAYILLRIEALAAAGEDLVLGCFCKQPDEDLECHGDVLKELILTCYEHR